MCGHDSSEVIALHQELVLVLAALFVDVNDGPRYLGNALNHHLWNDSTRFWGQLRGGVLVTEWLTARRGRKASSVIGRSEVCELARLINGCSQPLIERQLGGKKEAACVAG